MQINKEQMRAALRYWGWVCINDRWYMKCACSECKGINPHHTIVGLSLNDAVTLSQSNQYWFFNERGNMEELV